MVYQLVYGDSRVLLTDLGQAAADIKSMTTKINKGEGSLGAIINDPTIYEDLKEILGNVKRNCILRELVRVLDLQQRAGRQGREARREEVTSAWEAWPLSCRGGHS